jgi:hypothetical protein
MEEEKNNNPFSALSDAINTAVVKAGEYTVQVNAGRHVSSSGIGYESDFALTASQWEESTGSCSRP